MGATLEQIAQNLSQLRQTTAELSRDLRQVLAQYLPVLGRAVQQQLVMASFNLCTQVYPDAFLARSVAERETLQRQIRQLGYGFVEALAMLQASFETLPLEQEVDPSVVLEAWEALEAGIVALLQDRSRRINHLLQEAEVMHIKGLDKLLDSAAKATESGRTITNPPHLLKALVDPEESEEDGLNPVVAIYLQLADLEFTDPELMGWRQQLRPLLQKLSQVQQSYAQKQEEQLIAEAIAAWTATWTTEDPLPQNPLPE